MDRILVTGGAGYVGSHACKALAQSGYEPVVYDNLSRGHRRAVRYGPLEIGDLADRARLDEVLARHRPEAVLHFAAYAYVGESVEQPELYYRNNVAGTLCLLEALRDHGIRRLVFSSTCAVYGEPQTERLAESHPREPVNPYGRSKLMVERMLEDFHAAHGINSIALRYFNAAGADIAGELGEDHRPETHLIPLALAATLEKGEPLILFGDDYPTPDGTCIRDYVHVDDLAQAHLLALERSGEGFQAVNLGYGRGYSVREVLDCVSGVIGRKVRYQIGARRPGDPPILVADPGRSETELGWHPRHHSLETIIASAWNWFRTLR